VRIVVITSCTGEKAVEHEQALLLEDFKAGEAHIKEREAFLEACLTSAEALYTGQQHVRLMRGIERIRNRTSDQDVSINLELHILSAGYGLVPAEQKLAPYEATFTGMKAKELREWSTELQIPSAFREVLSEPYDLALLLLGDAYLTSCQLDESIEWGGPTLAFCGSRMAKKLSKISTLTKIPLANPQAKRFSCGLIGLKGELCARLLGQLSEKPELLTTFVEAEPDFLLALLDEKASKATKSRKTRSNPAVHFTIAPPEHWWEASKDRKPRYFIPDWDDRVDPDYDFTLERHWGGRGNWNNEVYAHQMLETPAYDGLLVSRVVIDGSKSKREVIAKHGVHKHLRVPDAFPVLGDCGAFGYIDEDEPPYSTEDVLEYYTSLGFNLGVSVDHLIHKGLNEQEQKRRYQLTIENASDFIRTHKQQGLQWTPMGAVQGWDASSYAHAAEQYVKMGYTYIALGGLVRSRTPEVLDIVTAVRKVIPTSMQLHLFGLARPDSLADYRRLQVTSIDSASMLRTAWLGSNRNYLGVDGEWYSAIRIPQTDASFRAKRAIKNGEVARETLLRLEASCLSGIRKYAQKPRGKLPKALLDDLVEFDSLLAGERKKTRERIQRTLEARPWEACPCHICKDAGVEVVIFRGNNRNRRRGFHNTYVFYNMLGQVLPGEEKSPQKTSKRASSLKQVQQQMSLFEAG